jgi:hypothetical protein
MGVSISRPPRCERGALPTELIAPEGTHKLPARDDAQTNTIAGSVVFLAVINAHRGIRIGAQ